MLFFRSEEQVRSWCRMGGYPLRPRMSLDQLWRLAEAWYSNRLSSTSRRSTPGEVVEIFAGLGLDDDFWNPSAGVVG